MTDLDALRAFFARSPFMADLGVEPTAVAPGQVSAVLVIATRHLQHTGQVHAGVMAALADHCMGAAAQTQAPQGLWALTAELKTSQLRAAQGERLVCQAWVVKAGRTLSFTEAEVYAESPARSYAAGENRRTLVMKSSATMALVAPAGPLT